MLLFVSSVDNLYPLSYVLVDGAFLSPDLDVDWFLFAEIRPNNLHVHRPSCREKEGLAVWTDLGDN